MVMAGIPQAYHNKVSGVPSTMAAMVHQNLIESSTGQDSEVEDEEYDYNIKCYSQDGMYLFSDTWAFVNWNKEEFVDALNEGIGRYIERDGYSGDWYVSPEFMDAIQYNDYIIEKNHLDIKVTLSQKESYTTA